MWIEESDAERQSLYRSYWRVWPHKIWRQGGLHRSLANITAWKLFQTAHFLRSQACSVQIWTASNLYHDILVSDWKCDLLVICLPRLLKAQIHEPRLEASVESALSIEIQGSRTGHCILPHSLCSCMQTLISEKSASQLASLYMLLRLVERATAMISFNVLMAWLLPIVWVFSMLDIPSASQPNSHLLNFAILVWRTCLSKASWSMVVLPQ